MINSEGLPSRLKFMLLDVIDLRKHHWKAKGAAAQKGPATIDEVRNQAIAAQREAEAKAAADHQRSRGGGGGGRPGIGRGDARNFSGGGMPPPDYQRNTVDMNDLRRLNRNRPTGASAPGGPMGPTSMFNTRGSNTKRTSMAPGGIFNRGGGDDSGNPSRTGTPPIRGDKKDDGEKPASANAFR